MNDNPQYTLSEHLCAMQNKLTETYMKHWRNLLEGTASEIDVREIRATLTSIEERLIYARNCCAWIETEIVDNWAKATNNTDP
jgi:hypothetical protein